MKLNRYYLSDVTSVYENVNLINSCSIVAKVTPSWQNTNRHHMNQISCYLNLNTVFISDSACITCSGGHLRKNNMLRWASYGKNQVSGLQIWWEGVWRTKHDGIVFVALLHIIDRARRIFLPQWLHLSNYLPAAQSIILYGNTDSF